MHSIQGEMVLPSRLPLSREWRRQPQSFSEQEENGALTSESAVNLPLIVVFYSEMSSASIYMHQARSWQ